MKRVDLSESQRTIYGRLVNEINRSAKRFKHGAYRFNEKPFEALLGSKSLSLPSKKERLLHKLHSLAVSTFAVPAEKLSPDLLSGLTARLKTPRKLILKLRSLNYYYEHGMLGALRLAKPLQLGTLGKTEMLGGEKPALGAREMEHLEMSICYLINRVIHVDRRLLKGYRGEEARMVAQEKISTTDFSKVLRKQSDLLCHLEAKLPPASHASKRLLAKDLFGEWGLRVFALLAAVENEYQKEQLIVHQLRKDQRHRKKLDLRIRHLVQEQWGLLRLKEKRLLAMEQARNIDKEHQAISHLYAASLHL